MGAINTLIIFNNLKSLSIISDVSPDAPQLASITQLPKSQILLITAKSKTDIEAKVKVNCKDYIILETEIDKMPATETKIDVPEDYKFKISATENKKISGAIKKKKAFIIKLHFDIEDKLNGINSYVIFNNLNKSAGFILSYPTIEKIKSGVEFTTFDILYCGNLYKEDIIKKISINCRKFEVISLTKQNLKTYITAEEDTKSTSKNTKSKKSPELKKETLHLERDKFFERQPESVIVEVDKFIVEGVIDYIGEMIVNMNFMGILVDDLLTENSSDPEYLKNQIQLLNAQLQGTTLMCNALMDYAVLLKLVPLKPLFQKIPRIVRDTAKKVNKKVIVETEGERIRVDQKVMNALETPLFHILRNCVDHGIEAPEERIKRGKNETGKIIVQAIQHHRDVMIEIKDDGNGIDKKKVLKKAIEKGLVDKKSAEKLSTIEIYKFIFNPGFSTKDVASEVSGRGVGMDVVLNDVEKIGGSIELESDEGLGSTFRLIYPIML